MLTQTSGLLSYVAALGTGFVQLGASEIKEQSKPAHCIDLMVVSRHCGEGIVRRVRAYPDGRVDGSPWAAYARMSQPRSFEP